MLNISWYPRFVTFPFSLDSGKSKSESFSAQMEPFWGFRFCAEAHFLIGHNQAANSQLLETQTESLSYVHLCQEKDGRTRGVYTIKGNLKSPNTIFYSIFLHFFRNDAKFLSLSFKQCFFCMHVYLDNFFHKISVKRIHTTNKTIYFSLKISPVTCFSLKHLHSLEMSRFSLKYLHSLETSTSTSKHLHSLEISRFTRHCVFCPVSAT